MENGKNITSVLLIFANYFWLRTENEFTIAIGEKKVTGIAKPGWNLDTFR